MNKVPAPHFAHEASATGYEQVDTSVSCLLTRFRVSSPLSLLRFFFWYRRIQKDANDLDGLLASAFVIENLHTCFAFSLWQNAQAILDFNNRIFSHVQAANSSFSEVKFESDGPRIWSAQFRLSAVSPHNFRWDGVNLEPMLNRLTRSALATPNYTNPELPSVC